MRRGWVVMAACLQWGCGACAEEEAIMQELVLPPIEGGEESAEALAQAWFTAIAMDDPRSTGSLALSIEQLELVVDCGDEAKRARLIESQTDLSGRLETTVSTVAAELRAAGERLELDRARSNSSTQLGAGASYQDCVLLRPVTRHQVRSFAQRIDSEGKRSRVLRLAAALEVDGHWFWTGVPSSVSSGRGSPKPIKPNKSTTVGPIIKGRAPIIVSPGSSSSPETGQKPTPLRPVPAQ
jgi:hypothetical protein